MFAVRYTYNDDIATRDRMRSDHREYLGRLTQRKHLLLAGGLGPGGALLLYRAVDDAQVRQFVADDPFNAAGVIITAEIVSWSPALGTALTAFAE